MQIDKVLVIFKTHLDVGFTDLAKNVVNRYMDSFIPDALEFSAALRESGSKHRFVWNTGSWLIAEYLRTRPEEEKQKLINGIHNGDIAWHGLPFTTHTEIMSAELFEYSLGEKILIRYSFPKEAHEEAGCPLLFDAIIAPNGNELEIDLAWFGKPANRVAEAIWCGFRPIASNKKISKLGHLIDPKRVVEDGQCRLHATDFGVVYDELTIETLDAALVAPQEPSILNFTNVKPLDGDPVYFNLYNNAWGTNFPMWYDEDARFRFVLKI